MKRSRIFFSLLVCSLVILPGCKKKQPATTPPPVTTATVEQPPVEVTQSTPSTEHDPLEGLMSQDLEVVNQTAFDNGLLGDVFFDFDQYDLRPDARDRLAKNARFLLDNPTFVLTVEGHCDERGTNEYNLALGDRRASAVRDYLASLGVSAARFRTISYGEERPFCTSATEDCWAKNRRAHFVITGRS